MDPGLDRASQARMSIFVSQPDARSVSSRRSSLCVYIALLAALHGTACADDVADSEPAVRPMVFPAATASTPDAGPPAPDGEAYCAALRGFAERCPGAVRGACGAALASNCAVLAGQVLNPTLVAAAAKCVASAACGVDPASCLAAASRAAQPTLAHRTLAKAYCGRCAVDAGASCEADVLGPSGDGASLAKLVLPLGDKLVGEVQSACIDVGCDRSFAACAEKRVGRGLLAAMSLDAARCAVDTVGGPLSALPSELATMDALDGGVPAADAGRPPTFDVHVSVSVPSSKSDGSPWDPPMPADPRVVGDSALPDPFLRMTMSGGLRDVRFNTSANSLLGEAAMFGVPEAALSHVRIEVADEDPVGWDSIGQWEGALTVGGPWTLLAARGGDGPGFTFRYQVTPSK